MSLSQTPFNSQYFLKITPEVPGVYRMFSVKDEIIYIGKAKNLKKRLTSYFQKHVSSIKTRALVKEIHHIEISVTHTEIEALLLEQNLIKQYRPKYNILLRDDKSYPYIFLSSDTYPRISIHRGARRQKGHYYGPYPSAGAVRETLSLLQKLFKVRQCENSYFNNRTRPCLQYQIKRCNAPCMHYMSEQSYEKDVAFTRMILQGKNSETLQQLIQKMEQASAQTEYEQAAAYRDQVQYLRQVMSEQSIEGERGELDVLAVAIQSNLAVVHVIFVRGGRVIGSRNYFPDFHGEEEEDIINAFIPQFYLTGKKIPKEIICTHVPADKTLLEIGLSEVSGRQVAIKTRLKSQRKKWQQLAVTNAHQALELKLASKGNQQKRLMELVTILGLEHIPTRMECFDISHTSGESTIASCVVFDQDGPKKSEYRRFNIKGITGGDDYAAMEQALKRRFLKVSHHNGVKPDILFIDGGKGQLQQAINVLEELEVDNVLLIGIAKGAERKAGAERLFLANETLPIIIDSHSPALHLIQHIRDESHRFAITGHRKSRDKKRQQSLLEQIPGIGIKRRQNLLKQFGGLQGLKKAALADITTVPGFNRALAQKVYDFLKE